MKTMLPNRFKSLGVLGLLWMSLGGQLLAQVQLLEEVKITDSVLFFDGTKNENSTNKDVNAPYDYVYGNALTPHGDCIKVFNEFVFMTWYRGGKEDRHVMLTRYNTKTGVSKTIEFPHQHTGFNGKWWIGETHNTIGIGICPKDSTIHMLYDQHRNANVPEFVANDDVLRYTYSEKGAATVADEDFTIDRFVNSSAGNYKHQSFHGISGGNTDRITSMLTYPAFFTNNEGDLFLKNRFGYAANGKFVFAYYDGNAWNGYYDFNYTEAQNHGSDYSWGLYGDIKYANGKMRIGFQRRSGNKNDRYLYQNGIYYAYSDNPKGTKDWKDHSGAGFPIPLGDADRIKVAEPGDWVQTTQKDQVYIVGGFDWTVTDGEDVHIVSEVKDTQYNVKKKLHTYKPFGATDFTTVEYSAGSELYAAGNDVYVIGLKSGRVNIAKTKGGTSDFKQVYQHQTGPTFDKGIVCVYEGKLYYYLKQAGGSGAKRTTYLQIFDLDIDTTPVDQSRDLSFKNLYNNQEILAGSSLSIEANVGSAFKEVTLWYETTNLGSKTEAPFVWSDHAVLTNMTEASYTFKLLAKDSSDVEVERSVTIKTVLPSANTFSGEGQYTFYNPNKSKWMGADVATDDALVTDAGDAENNKFNVVANGEKYNIYTADYKKVVLIKTADGFTSMLADTTAEVLNSADALFEFKETSSGSEMYFIESGAIDPTSSKNFKLNVKSSGADIGRGTSELPNYQWQLTRIGDLVASVDNVAREDALSIYPNPAKDIIFIKGANVRQAKVYTLSGQLAKDHAVSLNQVDVSQLKQGVYLIQLEDVNGQVSTRRFMIE